MSNADGPASNATGADPIQPTSPLDVGQAREVDAGELAGMAVKKPGPMTLADRQGVFGHSFKCSVCDVESTLFSWMPARHRVGSVFCPECGERTPMLHWATRTSYTSSFQPDGPGLAFFATCPPFSNTLLLDDSVLVEESRYEQPR